MDSLINCRIMQSRLWVENKTNKSTSLDNVNLLSSTGLISSFQDRGNDDQWSKFWIISELRIYTIFLHKHLSCFNSIIFVHSCRYERLYVSKFEEETKYGGQFCSRGAQIARITETQNNCQQSIVQNLFQWQWLRRTITLDDKYKNYNNIWVVISDTLKVNSSNYSAKCALIGSFFIPI